MMVHHLHQAIRQRQAGIREGTASMGTDVGQAASLTAERFLELGRGLRWAAESWPGVWRPITRLNNRFDQLWCMLLEQLGEPAPSPNQYYLEWARMRTSPLVGRFDLYSAEVLGNPLLRPRRLEELLQPRPVRVKPVAQWACANIPYEIQQRSVAELRHLEAERPGCPASLMGSLDYRLLRQARKPRPAVDSPDGPQGDAKLGAEQGAELPRDFEEFAALVEAALGQGSGFGDQGPAIGLRGSGLGARGNHGSGAAVSRNPAPDPQPPAPPTLRELARLLWDSATLHRRRAAVEARCLGDYLIDYASRLSSGDSQDITRRRRVAAEILKLFRQGVSQQEESVTVTRGARLAMHDIAVERFGRRPEWGEELLCPNDRFEQHRIEFLDLYFAEFNWQAAAEDG